MFGGKNSQMDQIGTMKDSGVGGGRISQKREFGEQIIQNNFFGNCLLYRVSSYPGTVQGLLGTSVRIRFSFMLQKTQANGGLNT